ncbi:xylose ABC transporter ATPase [Bifidobacterium actinocoloniiforme DSM 22766]|uniref:Xylose ABC transporter ATPase n=1 Tax=Bifidobacterium actinocoloniiforme DSM 22766 TaxID=1437605 RepID=A0A086Z158_9BIFI|nr:sugar ABC transporter ATP-binding protein [Bifidobacterium actinocoloniiforme]AKV55426.1 ABC transporter ATP-binding protein [Bifidobacterium actinocoloniiforme DSM 22766]KFI40258.1 xylose ABC transporter ATPase [Bifidobacterium actinocoloniiforme DSM 22766]
MSDSDTILHMDGITKTFGQVTALSQVNLSVERGEIHAICGENGAGKSTLMNVLSGVYPYGSYTGTISFDGKTCKYRNIKDSEADGIVIIHQELALSPYLSVAENIFIGNEQAKGGVIDWNATRSEAKRLMERVGLPDDPDTKIMDMGVGKQQLVEIAKALSKNVKLLILDEPTAALNDEDSAHLLSLVRQLRDEHGVTCIIITHKLNEVAQIADNVTIIRDGSTVGTMFVTKETPLDQDELIRKMVGRPLTNLYPDHPANKPGPEYFRIEDWTVHHPLDSSRVVVDHANIEARSGEIVGLAGLMGAGRTELAMSVFGRSYGSGISGSVYIKGKKVNLPNVQAAIDAGLAYATEDRKVYGLNLLQNIRENASMASLKRMSKNGVMDDNEEVKEVEKYRREFRIKCRDIDEGVDTLSGGNQQKVVLSKWVIADPDILILDEPTRGIDVGAKYEIYEIIDQLADAGKAVIVISSELPELIGICDRIYTVSQGVITDNVDKNGFTQEYLMKGMTKEKEVAVS